MKIIDLTHTLVHGQPGFPSDPKLSIVPHGTIPTLGYNISQIVMSSHQGTHLDAPYHFIEDGKTIDQMSLERFYGPAVLLDIPKNAQEDITRADFEKYRDLLVPGARVLYHTGWQRQFGKPEFFRDFPSMTVEAAKYLASRQIGLIGMDTPTPSRDYTEVHNVLLGKGVEMVVVESLNNLDQLPKRFLFSGFPLKFGNGDGSPIRAVAIIS